jgi:uncharacterized protein YaiE (UPF0345 family)
MLKVNEYFDGKVKSIGFEDSQGPITSGVMMPGEFTFSTGAPETMTVVTGSLAVRRPEDSDWMTFLPGQPFSIPGGVSFDVRVEEPTSYTCRYG